MTGMDLELEDCLAETWGSHCGVRFRRHIPATSATYAECADVSGCLHGPGGTKGRDADSPREVRAR